MRENENERLAHLAALAANGDEDSFVALCDAMKNDLFRAAKGILGDDDRALEAVSESVFRAYNGIKRLREPKYAATWFTRILINVANDIYKRQKHETSLDAAQNIGLIDAHSKMDFEQMIRSLPPELREIVSLKYYSEFTHEEISRILKLPIGTVKSRLSRALKLLRLEVEG